MSTDIGTEKWYRLVLKLKVIYRQQNTDTSKYRYFLSRHQVSLIVRSQLNSKDSFSDMRRH